MGGGNVWLNPAVYPLWVTMAAGTALLVVRGVQWIGYDQDMQVSKVYRKSDPADSDFLEKQGETYYNHAVRKFFQGLKGASPNSILIFPEPTAVTNAEDAE